MEWFVVIVVVVAVVGSGILLIDALKQSLKRSGKKPSQAFDKE